MRSSPFLFSSSSQLSPPFPPFVPRTRTITDAVSQWVTSKEALGIASSTKRPTSCVMIAKLGMKRKLKDGEVEKEGAKEAEDEFHEAYVELEKEVEVVSLCFSRVPMV